MNWSDFNMWLYGLVTALISGVIYLVRRVFTNEKQIDLLKQKLETMETYRFERDQKLEHQLIEIRSDVKSLMRRGE